MIQLWRIAAVSILLLLAAMALMAWHIRAWEAFQRREADAAEFHYRRRQFRRRMQTSAMLALAAIALGVGHPLTSWLGAPWFVPIYWIAVLLLVCWMVLLALIDAWSSRLYYGRLQQRCRLEELQLQAEVRRLQAARDKGDADEERKEPAN
jgi:small-conductance mechanosensitive channel